MPTFKRAELGLARTFQIMRLFPRLTVEENVLIGSHRRNRSNLTSNMLMLGSTRSEDERCRRAIREILALLDLEQHVDTRVSDLPFGVLRMVDLARALALEPSLLMLDEPASGLDAAETERFAEHLATIRDQMDIPILLIEHDMSLVMQVTDYVYALDFGRNLAQGTPDEIRADERVVAAYLGDEAGLDVPQPTLPSDAQEAADAQAEETEAALA